MRISDWSSDVCSSDLREALRGAIPVRNPSTAGTVHADGMHLVEIGERTIFLGEIANGVDGGDVTIHRINALECDQLGECWIRFSEQLFQVLKIVVTDRMSTRLNSSQ